MTAFFRMIGAAFPNFDAASKVSGFSISALILYIGYQIPKPRMYVGNTENPSSQLLHRN
jgi:hypothetical protein